MHHSLDLRHEPVSFAKILEEPQQHLLKMATKIEQSINKNHYGIHDDIEDISHNKN